MTFTADVNKFIRETEGATEAVLKQSIQDVVKDAQISRFKGGNMPIDTSFLTNSGKAELGSLPVGESEPPENYTFKEWSISSISLTLSRMRVGETFYYGWTAKYARVMENRYKFMRLAAQKWSDFVRVNAQRVERGLRK